MEPNVPIHSIVIPCCKEKDGLRAIERIFRFQKG